MPRARRRTNIGNVGGAPPGGVSGGLAGPMHGTVARGRKMTARTTTGNSGIANKQLLATPRQNVTISSGPITAALLTDYVNTICDTELSQPGFIANNPVWAYNLGVRMFGGGI
jgi:hypothetical protein